MSNGMNGKDFIIGTIIGGVIGAATALFLAPKSGKELRHNLNEQASYVREKTEQWKNVAIDKGSELAEAAKEKTAHLTDTVSGQSSQLIHKTNELAQETGNQLEEIIEKVKDSTDVIATSQEGLTLPNNPTDEIQRKLEETRQALADAETEYSNK